MSKERAFQLRQSLLLLVTALIWGFAFAAQSVGMDYIGPFTLIAVRFPLGALTLLPVILAQEKKRRKSAALSGGAQGQSRITPAGSGAEGAADGKTAGGLAMSGGVLVRGGILCGLALGSASILQQHGIARTTVGKAGFLTAMYIVIVPILGVFTGKKLRPLILVCVVIACAGIYFLSMPEGSLSLQPGDALCLASAFLFAVQIMLVDHYTALADGVRLSAIQFLTVSVMGAVLMMIFEHPDPAAIFSAAIPLLYLGVLSSGVGYTLQVIGQRGLNPTVASLIMSLESTFAVLAGFLILHQSLSLRELGGCGLMAAAIILAQIV